MLRHMQGHTHMTTQAHRHMNKLRCFTTVHSHDHTGTQADVYMLIHMHTCILKRSHRHAQMFTHMLTYMHKDVLTGAHTCIGAQACTQMSTCLHTDVHTNMRAQYAYMHTHIHRSMMC